VELLVESQWIRHLEISQQESVVLRQSQHHVHHQHAVVFVIPHVLDLQMELVLLEQTEEQLLVTYHSQTVKQPLFLILKQDVVQQLLVHVQVELTVSARLQLVIQLVKNVFLDQDVRPLHHVSPLLAQMDNVFKLKFQNQTLEAVTLLLVMLSRMFGKFLATETQLLVNPMMDVLPNLAKLLMD